MTKLEFIKKYQLALLMVFLVIFMGIAAPKLFFTPDFFINVFLTISIYGIMVCGTIFVVIRGGVDLSNARIAAFSGTIVAKYIIDHSYSQASVWQGILIALIVSVMIGVINGVLTEVTQMPAMIVTLATQKIISAANQLYIESKTLTINKPASFVNIANVKILGIPACIIIFVVFIILSYLILEHTVFGRQVYAVGGNAKTSRYTGINDKRIGIMCFAISGLTAGIAGIVLASFNNQAVYYAAESYEGFVLIALAIGGVSLSGGEGNIVGAILGTILLGMINRSLILLSIDSVYHDIFRGAIIIIAVAIDAYTAAEGTSKRKLRKMEKLENAKKST